MSQQSLADFYTLRVSALGYPALHSKSVQSAFLCGCECWMIPLSNNTPYSRWWKKCYQSHSITSLVATLASYYCNTFKFSERMTHSPANVFKGLHEQVLYFVHLWQQDWKKKHLNFKFNTFVDLLCFLSSLQSLCCWINMFVSILALFLFPVQQGVAQVSLFCKRQRCLLSPVRMAVWAQCDITTVGVCTTLWLCISRFL